MAISSSSRGLRPGVCTSTTRPSNPYDGMVIYETDTDKVAVYDVNAWVYKTNTTTTGAIRQVVSTTKTDTFSVSTSSFVDVTGLTVTITPTSASNKILVIASVNASQDVGINNGFLRLARGATGIDLGDAASSRYQATTAVNVSGTDYPDNFSMLFLDSPSTTSATTYAVQISAHSGGGTMFVNRSDSDGNNAFQGRYASTITVMEVIA